jgi:DNA integrity scanning protein DisA with diadenylate cyclase activity
MKIYTSEKIIAWLTLISGLSISAVAVWYSVAGLVSIFAAAAIPIMIMGISLEVSKLVATVWLKMNWNIAPKLIKSYLIAAIAILMVITSMGIFGFLSKAHLDQAVPTGDVVDQVSLFDEKIKTQKENVDAARKALKQMDESVDQAMARSTDEKGAERSAALRRGQARERTQLQNDIAKAQKEIANLNEQRAPIAKELRKVEAEVGPIKYIAALLYGDNPDQNILEKAVRWVIIVIVMVFDPLAVILLLASQYSFQWFRKKDEEGVQEEIPVVLTQADEILTQGVTNSSPADNIPLTTEIEEEESQPYYGTPSAFWPFPSAHELQTHTEEVPGETPLTALGGDITATEEKPEETVEDLPLDQWNKMIAEAEKAVDEEEDEALINTADELEKEAMRQWKSDNPGATVKFHRGLFESGKIDTLPWDSYLKAEADFTDNEAAEEAAKWALEQLEDSKKKESTSWIERVEGQQIKRTKE